MENLGKKAQDKITGFEGIIVAKIYYLTGCNQYGIAPKVSSDGKVPETSWFDVKRVAITGEGFAISEVAEEHNPGGPNRDCPK